MKNRTAALLLALAFLLSALPVGVTAASEDNFTYQADTLNKLGLFAGSDKGYELERDATRAEAAVMVVKLLGKDEEAKRESYSHPFTDVPAWADCYVGYIYSKGITAGISETEFGTYLKATPAQYATFMLKALGYSAPVDFEWTRALDKMAELKILSSAEASSYGAKPTIPRGVVVAVSHASLLARPKGSAYSLLHRLYVRDAAFDQSKLASAAARDANIAQIAAARGVPAPSQRAVMDSEAIFAACSPAVFYVEIFSEWYSEYIEDDEPWGTGSGFFITADGIAVTNYHVIEDADVIKIRTSDGKTYEVEKILGYSEDADIAILKVDRTDGGSFPYLRLADPYTLRAAQRIYCIGSPLGYDNTITDGLVSSTVKQYSQIYDKELIQISAPISSGSSGGAVINEFGDVAGITTMGYTGESLNFAVPVTKIAEVKLFDPPKTLKEIYDEISWGWPDTFEPVDEEGDNGEEPSQELADETQYNCALSGADDVDLFSLPSEVAAELSIRLRADEKYVGHIAMELIDLETGGTVARSFDVEDAPYKYLDYHIVKGAKLALRIASDGDEGLDWGDVEYKFGSFIREPATEFAGGGYYNEDEPNDSFAEATYIAYCSYAYGELADRKDKDYYRFYIDERTDVSFYLGHYNMLSDTPTKIKAELYGADEQLISTLSFTDIDYSDDDYTINWNTQRLKEGWYYIAITATGTFEGESYNIHVGPKADWDY